MRENKLQCSMKVRTGQGRKLLGIEAMMLSYWCEKLSKGVVSDTEVPEDIWSLSSMAVNNAISDGDNGLKDGELSSCKPGAIHVTVLHPASTKSEAEIGRCLGQMPKKALKLPQRPRIAKASSTKFNGARLRPRQRRREKTKSSHKHNFRTSR